MAAVSAWDAEERRLADASDPATNAAVDKITQIYGPSSDEMRAAVLAQIARRDREWRGEPEPDDDPMLAESSPETPTGWERVDLRPILDGGQITTEPALWRRHDGVAMLYPGRVHSFAGEPESLKSWGAQAACASELVAGRVVMYLDFEDTPEGLVDRMSSLGVTRETIAERFWYHRVDQPLSFDAAQVLDGSLAEARPALVVLDGVTEAMALLGLSPYDNADAARFWQALPRRLTAVGAAVILIDHVTKDREGRGRWAIGAQHKLAAVDGAAFTFEVVRPFGRGEQHGIARVGLVKDRPGHLRQHCAGGVVAELHCQSWPDGGVDVDLQAPTGSGDGTFRPTVLMERVSRYVEEHDGISKNGIATAIKGDDKAKRLAVELLAAEGYVAIERVRQTHSLRSLRPFRNEQGGDA